MKTVVFTVSTSPRSPELGGGTQNIAFLVGAPAGGGGGQQGPNALAALMTATFWIETVEHQIIVPVWQAGHVSFSPLLIFFLLFIHVHLDNSMGDLSLSLSLAR